MTSSYRHLGARIDKPVVGTLEENFGREEVDMSESLEDQMRRLNEDENAYANLLISQYNHIHSNFSRWPEQFQGILGQSVETANEFKRYQDSAKVMIDYHNRIKNAKKYKYEWVAEQPEIKNSPFKEEILQGVEEEDDSKIALIDNEVAGYVLQQRKADEVQNEAESLKASATENGQIDLANAADRGVLNEDGVGSTEQDRLFYQSASTLKMMFKNTFYGNASGGLKVIVGNGPDGKPIYQTLSLTGSAEEAILISDIIATHFLEEHKHLTMGKSGRFKKEFVTEIFKISDELLVTHLSRIGDSQKEQFVKERALEIKNRLQVDKGFIPRYVMRYRNAHNGSTVKSKAEAIGFVENLIKTNVFDREDVDPMLDAKFIARDPNIGETSIREYWPKETKKLLAALGQAENVQREADLQEHKDKSEAFVHNAKMESINRKEPYSLDEKHKIIQDYMSTFKVGMEEVPNDLKNLYTVATVPDQDILYHLAAKNHRNPGSVSMKDLEGIQDFQTKKKAIEDYLTDKGVDAAIRDSFIIGEVDHKTQNTLGEDGRTREWRAYQYNAQLHFNAAYQRTRDAGGDHQAGMTAGMEAVRNGLFGKDAGEKWGKWPGPTYSANDSRQLGIIQRQIGKDPVGMINSETPWEGEVPHIKSALLYLNNQTGNIPEFYKQFNFIKRLPDGRVNFPERFMRYRLEKLGLLKNDKPLPEEQLPTYLQEKLLKPNPSKTLQVISNPEGLNLLPAFVINSSGEEVSTVQVLRNQASINQQYNTLIAGNHTRQVNLPEEITTRFHDRIRGLPSDLHLNNLAPVVAKAFAEDVLMA